MAVAKRLMVRIGEMARVCVSRRFFRLGLPHGDHGSFLRRAIWPPVALGTHRRLAATFGSNRSNAFAEEGFAHERFANWADYIEEESQAHSQIDAYLEKLSHQQHNAAVDTARVVRVIAGPGSGKTRVLIARVANLIASGVHPDQLLVLTFTNKAAKEVNERLKRLLGDDRRRVKSSGTFHSIACRILRGNIRRLKDNRTPEFRVVDDDEAREIILELLMEENGIPILSTDTPAQQKAKKKKNSDLRIGQRAKAKILEEKISAAKDRVSDCYGISGKEVTERYRLPIERQPGNRTDCTSGEFAWCYDAYTERLREDDLMDFGDLISGVVWLFKNDREVLNMYRRRYRHILVDEMQDINGPQHEFLRLLMLGNRKEDRDFHPPTLFVVGDPNQSIYGFRGGQMEHLRECFEQYFPTGVATHKLVANYRSAAHIVRIAEQILTKSVTSSFYTSMEVKRLDRRLDRVSIYSFIDETLEAQYVANHIKRLAELGDIELDQVAILYRNHYLSRCFEAALDREGIPYRVKRNSFWKGKEIKDLMAYLRVACDPSDIRALDRIYNKPTRGLGEASYGKLQKWCNDEGHDFPQFLFQDLMETETRALDSTEVEIPPLEIPKTLKFSKKAQAGLHSLRQIFVTLRSAARKGYADSALSAVMDRCGYYKYLIPDPSVRDSDKLKRLRAIKDLILSVKQRRDPDLKGLASLQAFVREAVLYAKETEEEEDEREKKVQLMTMHGSKGLEFSAVFVVGCEEEAIPGIVNGPDELEEEARLLFVAVTRAKDEITITSANSRIRNGRWQHGSRTQFLPVTSV